MRSQDQIQRDAWLSSVEPAISTQARQLRRYRPKAADANSIHKRGAKVLGALAPQTQGRDTPCLRLSGICTKLSRSLT
eukprot:327176-Amphidinium_carterae.2